MHNFYPEIDFRCVVLLFYILQRLIARVEKSQMIQIEASTYGFDWTVL